MCCLSYSSLVEWDSVILACYCTTRVLNLLFLFIVNNSQVVKGKRSLHQQQVIPKDQVERTIVESIDVSELMQRSASVTFPVTGPCMKCDKDSADVQQGETQRLQEHVHTHLTHLPLVQNAVDSELNPPLLFSRESSFLCFQSESPRQSSYSCFRSVSPESNLTDSAGDMTSWSSAATVPVTDAARDMASWSSASTVHASISSEDRGSVSSGEASACDSDSASHDSQPGRTHYDIMEMIRSTKLLESEKTSILTLLSQKSE